MVLICQNLSDDDLLDTFRNVQREEALSDKASILSDETIFITAWLPPKYPPCSAQLLFAILQASRFSCHTSLSLSVRHSVFDPPDTAHSAFVNSFCIPRRDVEECIKHMLSL